MMVSVCASDSVIIDPPLKELVDRSTGRGVDCDSLSLVRGVDSGANSVFTSAERNHSEKSLSIIMINCAVVIATPRARR